jgi:hypothetical protein
MENSRVKRAGLLQRPSSCEEGYHSPRAFAAKKILDKKISKNPVLYKTVIRIISALFSSCYE